VHKPFLGMLAIAFLAVSLPSAAAPSAWLGNEICAVLTTLVPEVQQFDPEAARQRFISAITMKFRDDPAKLRQVRASIDRETIATCRKERESLMKIMQTLSLSEAFEQRLF
jgi:hypothetical protein